MQPALKILRKTGKFRRLGVGLGKLHFCDFLLYCLDNWTTSVKLKHIAITHSRIVLSAGARVHAGTAACQIKTIRRKKRLDACHATA